MGVRIIKMNWNGRATTVRIFSECLDPRVFGVISPTIKRSIVVTIVPNITALLVPIMDAARAVVRAAAAVLNHYSFYNCQVHVT